MQHRLEPRSSPPHRVQHSLVWRACKVVKKTVMEAQPAQHQQSAHHHAGGCIGVRRARHDHEHDVHAACAWTWLPWPCACQSGSPSVERCSVTCRTDTATTPARLATATARSASCHSLEVRGATPAASGATASMGQRQPDDTMERLATF